jgi:hypothetical protein
MKEFKGKITLQDRKGYDVTYPQTISASSLGVAASRLTRWGLKTWKTNGHTRQPISITLFLFAQEK